MKRKTTVILSTYVIAVIVVLMASTGIAMRREANMRRYIEAGWKRSFSALASDVSQIDTALQKCLYTDSAALMGSSFGEIYARTQEAQQNLSELPFSEIILEKTSGFLGKLGDYARVLACDVYTERPAHEQLEALLAMSETTKALSDRLTQLQAEIEQGTVRIGNLSGKEQQLELPGIEVSMEKTEDEFPELPTLIYDGPYSESADREEALFLVGMRYYSEAEIQKAAERFIGKNGLKITGRYEGKLPCYLLEGQNCCMRVSVQGGKLIDYYCFEDEAHERISVEEALKTAKEYLEARGFLDLTESYWRKEGTSILINYAVNDGGIILYPDLIKLRLSLSTGEVLGLDFTGYLLNHHTRSFGSHCSAEEAEATLSPTLTPLSSRLALIPTEGGRERLCWEFLCRTKRESSCLVYVDAVTGAEAKLLLLIEDANGTLTL